MTHQNSPHNPSGKGSEARTAKAAPWSDLQVKEQWTRWHNEVMDEMAARAAQHPENEARLLKGFLEIASIMLKNTCGVGSNFKLAECDIADIDKDAIRKYFTLVLSALGHHFCQLLPNKKDQVWDMILTLCSDPDTCRDLSGELDECRDHQSGDFSAVRAGRRLWERTAELLHVRNPGANVTARIYYQTAPGQDLIYLVEQAENAIWLKEG